MEKLKVILIDDETLIRKLLRIKIDWEDLGMEVVTEFSSARKALEEVTKWEPDIIITDICMPGMDGIEFSEECINLMPKVKIIILTGYDEFNYAMRSIKIGVSDYILKPIKAEIITQTLRKTREKIEKEKSYRTEYENLASQIEENLPVFQENYLNQVLLEPVSTDVFCRKMKFYHVKLNECCQQIQLAVLELTYFSKEHLEDEVDQNEIILYMKARKLTEEFFSGDAYFLFCRDGIGRIVILCNNLEVPLVQCLELLRKMLITRLKCYVSIGVSARKKDYGQITSAYKEAVEALSYKVVEGKNCVICYEHLKGDTSDLSAEDEMIWKEAKLYVYGGMREQAESSVQTLWEAVLEKTYEKENRARNMFIEIVSWCFNEAMKNDFWCQSYYQQKLTEVREKTLDVEQLSKEALECIGFLAKEMAIKDEKKSGDMLQDILVYINQNLSNPELSMNQVAEHFYISTGYLGRILKKRIGKTYGEYLSEMRFKKAQELLRTTDLKGYEIGGEIGIPDPHYLSIWFKKMSGDSLSEFRRQARYE